MKTGRRDGSVSRAHNVKLLGPTASVSDSIALFQKKGLTPTDMVILIGAHKVGVTHCSSIKHRLYSFNNTGKPDPTIDPSLVKVLRSRCPPYSFKDSAVNFHQMPLSPFILDNSYFKQLAANKGVLQIDQEMALNPTTEKIVRKLAKSLDFPDRFRAAMIKLGGIEVLTGEQGEVRRRCRVRNKPSSS